jgi:hypothetical protein
MLQGMNEIIGPIYYTLANDVESASQGNEIINIKAFAVACQIYFLNVSSVNKYIIYSSQAALTFVSV